MRRGDDGGEGQEQSDSGAIGNRHIYVYRGSEHVRNQPEKSPNNGNNKTRSSMIGRRMEQYLCCEAAAKRRKNDRIIGNMNGKCRDTNGNSTKHRDIVRNIKRCRKSVGSSEIDRKRLQGDAGVYPTRSQSQRCENRSRSTRIRSL